MAGLETWSVCELPYFLESTSWRNFGELVKEPNRKAVFRSIRWPAQSFVTIPCRGSSVTLSPSQVLYKPGGRAIPQIPESATRSEYQSPRLDATLIWGGLAAVLLEIRSSN